MAGADSRHDYRQAQEAWVTGHTGSSTAVALAHSLLVVVLSAVVARLAAASLDRRQAGTYTRHLGLELVLSAGPMWLALCWPEWNATALAALGALGLALLADNAGAVFGRPTPEADAARLQALNHPRKLALSHLRAGLLLSTCIAILAVDYAIFPRSFAKTENYGISVMDAGVGCFVFIGAVSSARWARLDQEHDAPAGVPLARRLGDLLRAVWSAWPLLLLGFGRLLAVRSTGYQEHASEYGRHWNFFFTLGAVPALVTLATAVCRPGRFVWLLAGLLPVWQWLLTGSPGPAAELAITGGLPAPEWVPWVVGQNREGLVSLAGYLAMALAGARAAVALFTPRPSVAAWRRVALDLLGASALCWAGYFLLSEVLGLDPSRRVANPAYALWIVAAMLLAVGALLLAETVLPAPGGSTAGGPLARALTRNQLALFLAANVSTGLVNLTTRTLDASPAVGRLAMLAYTAWLLGLAVLLDRGLDVTLRWW
ncbi:hypothetical protein H696_06025 [Fonticula alba]|uniref:GPI-anchored wall transfer protein n=1 Tax=Fonticula alba TaxID=691883 RepID=A0A058YZW1_FONAL|nr:hypothetical protein H696_06025 [Fonticula alba]KCV67505.1 hypothetical protein H696_06025 [Fonticula alba]|eukprot:XP_009498066.1 hypothetical protein H696_06025 [Fonticula alba]